MDKEALFKPRLAERVVTTEVGDIRIRALSRAEMADLREEYSDEETGNLADRRGFEYALIATAMVDPTDMTPDDVATWAAASPGGELIKVLGEVNALSGLDDLDGAKSVSANRRQRRAAVRARAGKGTR